MRQENEDYCYYSKVKKFFVVCDGMGGHNKGVMASKIAGETLSDLLLANETVRYTVIKNKFFDVVKACEDFKKNLPAPALKLLAGIRLANRRILQHAIEKNVLTRTLGMSPTVKIDLLIEAVQSEDLYLICSDGLFNALSNDLIQSILTAYHDSLQNKINNLVHSAKLMDGSDNITGGLIHISGQWEGQGQGIIERYTCNGEPPHVCKYLDQSVKAIYANTLPLKSFNKKKPSIIATIAAMFILAAFLIFTKGKTEKKAQPLKQTALFTQKVINQTGHNRPTITERKAGGQIVLLQINDKEYLQLLDSLEGIRVLDEVSQFKREIPVYAGSLYVLM